MPRPEPIATLLVDDEPPARRRLRSLVMRDPRLRLVGESEDGIGAVDAIRELEPELVFLDVQMPELTGFEVLASVLDDVVPIVVFVTAYDEFAIRAFDVGAVDYLLKPYQDDRFRVAVDRAARAMASPDAQRRHARATRLAAERYHESGTYLTRFAIPGASGITIVETRAIDWLESADNYVRVHAGGKVHRLRTTMADLLRKLDPAQFLRIHRWYAVNVQRIAEVNIGSHGDRVLHLTTGETIRASRSYAESLRPLLTNE